MSRFCHYIDTISKEKNIVNIPHLKTPNDFLKYMDIDVSKSPTICCFVDEKVAKEEPIFISRKEWDKPVYKNHTCLFISYPRAVAPGVVLAISLISLAVSVAITVYSILNQPDIPENQRKRELSPTYGLTNLQNSARLDEPIPVQYGTIRTYPDIASSYYSTIESHSPINQEWLYGRLCLGWGEFEIDNNEIKIDDTPIANFEDVVLGTTVKVLNPGDTPTIFTHDVQTAKDVGNIELEDDGWRGPFVVNTSGTTIDRLIMDVEFKKGLGQVIAPDDIDPVSVTVEMEVIQIDDDGNVVKDDFPIESETFNEEIIDPLRFTIEYLEQALPSGRYQVRFRRTDVPSTAADIQDEVTVTRLKGVSDTAIPVDNDKTYIEFKLRASEQLNQQNSNILNVLSSRKINYYDQNGVQQFGVNNSPIWAYYDMMTNTDYGVGLDTDRIELGHLLEIDKQITNELQVNEPPAECNIRFETSASAMEAASQIAACARCQVYSRAGKMWLARDFYRTAISAFFTPFNAAKNGLEISWQPRSKLAPNYFEVSYFDETTWQLETVSAVWPGETPEDKEELKILGITNRTKAWQEGRHYLAQDRLRRKKISIKTDVEGWLPDVFQKIAISHYNLSDHTSGKVEKIDGDYIHLSEPVDFESFAYGRMILKQKDGSALGPIMVSPGGTNYIVKINGDWDLTNVVTLVNCPDMEPGLFSFGLRTAAVTAIVTNISPDGDNQATVSCVVDDPRVYTLGKDLDLVPALGTQYIPEDPFKFQDATALIEADSNQVTVEWKGLGYPKYKVCFVYNIDDTIQIEEVVQDKDVTEDNIMVHTPGFEGDFPVQVEVKPVIEVNGDDLTLEEMVIYAVITVTGC